MTLRSKALNTAIAEYDSLSEQVSKTRNNRAFNRFLNTRINYTKQALQPLTQDIKLPSVQLQQKSDSDKKTLDTKKLDDGIITTKEYCKVPYPFVQSETKLYPDGTKIYTTFYPSNEGIPAKRIEISAKSTIVKTTTYDRNGIEKTTERILKNADGSGVEEKIDFKFSRKVIKKFNRKNITRQVESYVKDKLNFRLECDEAGNMLRESFYFSFCSEPILQKEVLYHQNGSYTTKEYNMQGKIHTQTTVFPKEDKTAVCC